MSSLNVPPERPSAQYNLVLARSDISDSDQSFIEGYPCPDGENDTPCARQHLRPQVRPFTISNLHLRELFWCASRSRRDNPERTSPFRNKDDGLGFSPASHI